MRSAGLSEIYGKMSGCVWEYLIVYFFVEIINCCFKFKGGLPMEMISIEKELKENSYPGRGIIVGRS